LERGKYFLSFKGNLALLDGSIFLIKIGWKLDLFQREYGWFDGKDEAWLLKKTYVQSRCGGR